MAASRSRTGPESTFISETLPAASMSTSSRTSPVRRLARASEGYSGGTEEIKRGQTIWPPTRTVGGGCGATGAGGGVHGGGRRVLRISGAHRVGRSGRGQVDGWKQRGLRGDVLPGVQRLLRGRGSHRRSRNRGGFSWGRGMVEGQQPALVVGVEDFDLKGFRGRGNSQRSWG